MSVALLATGDEVIHGDILNSNAQEIALRLTHHGIPVQTHMTVLDNIHDIEQAILFLLKSHRVIIITGGLGPTSDDLTRYALGNALNHPLVFDEITWDAIQERLNKFNLSIPENNRQQALFPEGATIIPNPNGTAAGCMVQHENKFIFMLPGPPPECLPMVDNLILPTLINADFPAVLYHKKWLLFGVSEGHIAEKLEALVKPHNCTTGYRICHPYLEFKLYSNNQQDFNKLVILVEKEIKPYFLGNGIQTASDNLRKKLEEINFTLRIFDTATGGLLESTLTTPQTISHLHFSADQPQIEITGLAEFWEKNYTATQTTLDITIEKNKTTTTLPLRGARVKQYAVEFICWQIYQFIIKDATN